MEDNFYRPGNDIIQTSWRSVTSVREDMALKNSRSSAYIKNLDILRQCDMSLTNILNNCGPKMLPCGIPEGGTKSLSKFHQRILKSTFLLNNHETILAYLNEIQF